MGATQEGGQRGRRQEAGGRHRRKTRLPQAADWTLQCGSSRAPRLLEPAHFLRHCKQEGGRHTQAQGQVSSWLLCAVDGGAGGGCDPG